MEAPTLSGSPATPQSPGSTVGTQRSVSSQLSLSATIRAAAAEGESSVLDPTTFVGGIGDWAKCKMCRKVPKVPMVHCVDECLFCPPCLVTFVDAVGDTKAKCPAPDCTRGLRRSQVRVAIGLAKAIQALPINCINKDSLEGTVGCTWTGSLTELPDHLTHCQGLLVLCPYAPSGCLWQGVAQLAESHISTCPQRVITCTNGRTTDSPGCGQQMFVSSAAFHLEHICQFVPCPNRLHKIDGTTFACPVFGFRRMIIQHLSLCKSLNSFALENRRISQVVVGLVAQRKALMQEQAEARGQVPALLPKEKNGKSSTEVTLSVLRSENAGGGEGAGVGKDSSGGVVANSMNSADGGVGGSVAIAEAAGKGRQVEMGMEKVEIQERPAKRTRSGSKRD